MYSTDFCKTTPLFGRAALPAEEVPGSGTVPD